MNHQKNILIIEDDESLRKILINKFTLEGFNTLSAKDGKEGLNTAMEKQPDLIVLDLLMPKMDGMTVLKKLRVSEWGSKVPVILLTNVQPDNQTISQISQDKPSYYLIKSDIEINSLITKVKDLLNIKND